MPGEVSSPHPKQGIPDKHLLVTPTLELEPQYWGSEDSDLSLVLTELDPSDTARLTSGHNAHGKHNVAKSNSMARVMEVKSSPRDAIKMLLLFIMEGLKSIPGFAAHI